MQQNRANPLLSRLGCASTIVMVMVLGILLRYFGGGPFSPGPLSAASPRQEPLAGFTSHADFEKECTRCHAPWQGSVADRCESCHVETGEQRAAQSGMHGRLPNTADCASCHTEHVGREAAITSYDVQAFDHDWLTNFTLAKHQVNYDGASILCQDCHPGRVYQVAQVDCQSCHAMADPTYISDHVALFGDDCTACHDGHDRMVPFDHRASFILEGAHENLDCRSCHTLTIATRISADCTECHAEPAVHAGQFGLDCARCHTAIAWLPAQLNIHTFPLNHGQESQHSCQSCHVRQYDEYTCTNCHEHEPDEIREEHVDAGILEFSNCIECHPTGLVDEFDDESA